VPTILFEILALYDLRIILDYFSTSKFLLYADIITLTQSPMTRYNLQHHDWDFEGFHALLAQWFIFTVFVIFIFIFRKSEIEWWDWDKNIEK
jgi:hypothetical protein